MYPKHVRACLYPLEKVGPNGLKAISAMECLMVFGQRVKEINLGHRNEVEICDMFCGDFLQRRDR